MGIGMTLTAELLGERVRDAIQRAGLTQCELAARIEMDATALSRALAGKRSFSSLEIGRISEALRISPLALLDSSEPPADPTAANVARVRWMAELDALLTSVGYPPSRDHHYPATLLDRAVEAWLAGHISIRPIAGLTGTSPDALLDAVQPFTRPHPAQGQPQPPPPPPRQAAPPEAAASPAPPAGQAQPAASPDAPGSPSPAPQPAPTPTA